MDGEIRKDRIETLYGTRFLSLYDLQYAEGKHYFEASRRSRDDLVVQKTDFCPVGMPCNNLEHLAEKHLTYHFRPVRHSCTQRKICIFANTKFHN